MVHKYLNLTLFLSHCRNALKLTFSVTAGQSVSNTFISFSEENAALGGKKKTRAIEFILIFLIFYHRCASIC